jgi:hypothetical protein
MANLLGSWKLLDARVFDRAGMSWGRHLAQSQWASFILKPGG